MAKDIFDIMLNPTRLRIVQALAQHNGTTTNEICDSLSDVPRATLYRHIRILIDANVVSVIDEKKIRGSVERTLSINTAELSKQNTMENIPQQALQYFLHIYTKFEKYFSGKTQPTEPNLIFFNNTIMPMNDQEFEQFLAELTALFMKYRFERADDRKPRDISIISAPPLADKQ